MPNLVDILSMLFFPPPTRFLNSKPQRSDSKQSVQTLQQKSGQNRPASDPADEEYVCSLCEYDLFFGSEQAMFRAIDRRKKVLERRQKAQEKAKGVMAGKGLRPKSKKGDDDDETEDDERCAGGEQCRCAEIRAGDSQDMGNDADSRGLEDTSHSTEDGGAQPQSQFDENTNADALLVANDQGLEPSSVAGLSSVSPSPINSKFIPTCTASADAAPPTEDEMLTMLPNVETFDLDESTAT
ncbi:hypothetical protein QFC19_002276 [Naganishia cerealis]|uniref:Uncharacterized protein n=1 Tax=Naganishia cerealis TaxID=610337 RepID=A0ACC2WB54_9TREE|nr:hypothetical protein QFC19_002276 [Naganishia cerealis]